MILLVTILAVALVWVYISAISVSSKRKSDEDKVIPPADRKSDQDDKDQW